MKWAVGGLFAMVFIPIVAAVLLFSPTSGGCGSPASSLVADTGGWHTVGATLDPTAGQAPTYSDHGGMSFAELLVQGLNMNYWQQDLSSVLGLPNKPYFGMPMETELLIRMPGSSRVFQVSKNDVGSGQPDPRYKIDLHPGIAQALGWHGNQDVQVAVARTGSGPTFVSNPVTPAPACATVNVSAPVTPGSTPTILPDGTASIPANAPPAVAAAITAGNEIHTKPYSIPEGSGAQHYGPLSTPWPAYDCSGTVSYVLWRAGLHSVNADVSGSLESWGAPGPGRWITVFANPDHTWVVVAGIAMDTSHYSPATPAGPGPRWQSNLTGNLRDGLSYVQRHPAGL